MQMLKVTPLKRRLADFEFAFIHITPDPLLVSPLHHPHNPDYAPLSSAVVTDTLQVALGSITGTHKEEEQGGESQTSFGSLSTTPPTWAHSKQHTSLDKSRRTLQQMCWGLGDGWVGTT